MQALQGGSTTVYAIFYSEDSFHPTLIYEVGDLNVIESESPALYKYLISKHQRFHAEGLLIDPSLEYYKANLKKMVTLLRKLHKYKKQQYFLETITENYKVLLHFV
jgi:hypothetical protein